MSEETETKDQEADTEDQIDGLRDDAPEEQEAKEGEKPEAKKTTRKSRTITPQQREILNFYKSFRAENEGIPPTNSQIVEGVRCNPSTVSKTLDKLEDLGYLAMDSAAICARLNAVVQDARANKIFILRPMEGGSFQGLRRFITDETGAIIME